MSRISWTAPNTHVFVSGELLSASTMNTFIKDNLDDLDRRTSPAGAILPASASTMSLIWVDLPDAVGPAVSVTVGSTGKAMVGICCDYGTNATNGTAHVSVACTGANTVAATTARQLSFRSPTGGGGTSNGRVDLFAEMLPGLTTFTMKYGCGVAATYTAAFEFRRLLVTPMGS